MNSRPIFPGRRPELAEQEAAIIAARGRVSELYQVLLNSPPLAHGWEQMLSAVRNHSSVPADLRELIILRVAVLNRAGYEFEAHVPHAIKSGMSEAKIAGVKAAGALDDDALYNEQERAVLRLTDTMTREIEVPDSVYDAVQAYFNDQQMVDLVATVAAYNMVSRFLIALQIGH